MISFSIIGEQSESESWSQFLERLGYYFKANNISEAEKKEINILTVCGTLKKKRSIF